MYEHVQVSNNDTILIAIKTYLFPVSDEQETEKE